MLTSNQQGSSREPDDERVDASSARDGWHERLYRCIFAKRAQEVVSTTVVSHAGTVLRHQ